MNDRAVFVVTHGVDVGSPLAAALAAGGRRTAWLSDAREPVAELGADVLRLHADFGSRAALARAFTAAAEGIGPADQVVISALPRAALQGQDIVSIGEAQWRAACGDAMKSVLYALQESFTLMAPSGGSIVVIGPSLSLAGAAQLVPLSTAVEGQRGLVKSTARQWALRGLSVNWIAAAPRGLSPLFDALPLPIKPDPVRVALGRPLDLATEVAPVIQFLGSAAGRVLTGATLMLDGGEWMVP